MIRILGNLSELPGLTNLNFGEDSDYAPFLGLEWHHILSSTVKQDNKKFLTIAYSHDGKETTGFVPCLDIQPNAIYKPRILESHSNFYTPLFLPLIDKNEQNKRSVMHAIANDMQAEKRWDVIKFQPMDPNSFIYGNIISAFEKLKWPVMEEICFTNWYHLLKGAGFQSYMSGRPSNLRNTLKRKQKKLNATGHLEVKIYTDGSHLPHCLPHYQYVYANSWKEAERFLDFIPKFAHYAASKQWLRLAVAYLDGRPIATQLWIVCGDSAYIYKLAHHKEFDKFSPGSILTMKMLEHVIDKDRVKGIDFLTGNDGYKKDWMDSQRQRMAITAFNPKSVSGIGSYIQSATRRFMREWVSKKRGDSSL